MEITEIRAKVLCDKWINEIEFVAKGEPSKGEITAKIGEECDEEHWQIRRLKPGEKIIGLYGVKNSKTCYSSIGFIVWKPLILD